MNPPPSDSTIVREVNLSAEHVEIGKSPFINLILCDHLNNPIMGRLSILICLGEHAETQRNQAVRWITESPTFWAAVTVLPTVPCCFPKFLSLNIWPGFFTHRFVRQSRVPSICISTVHGMIFNPVSPSVSG